MSETTFKSLERKEATSRDQSKGRAAMAKKRNAWMIRPARNPRAIPAPLTQEVEAKARELIEKVFATPPPK